MLTAAVKIAVVNFETGNLPDETAHGRLVLSNVLRFWNNIILDEISHSRDVEIGELALAYLCGEGVQISRWKI